MAMVNRVWSDKNLRKKKFRESTEAKIRKPPLPKGLSVVIDSLVRDERTKLVKQYKTMHNKFAFSNLNLAEQFCDIYEVGKVTNNDLRRWHSIGLSPSLSDEDFKLVTRLFHAVKRGWLEVVEV